MITNEGKIHIKRYLAGIVPSIGRVISFGIGDAAATLTDSQLQFEVSSTPVTLVSYDFDNDRLVFKANVPDEYTTKVYEIGLYSTDTTDSSRLLVSFDSQTETWNLGSGTFAANTTRIGADSLTHTPAASGSATSSYRDILLDLSDYSGADVLTFALNAGNANTSSINVRFKTDASNHYTFALGSQTAGYKILKALKSSATVTGSPSWSNITEVEVTTNSSAAGASNVFFDGIRIQDATTINLDNVLVARKVLDTPYVKTPGMTEEIEFSLDINV